MTAQFTNSVLIWNPKTKAIEAYYDDFLFPSNAIRFDGDLIVGELGAGRVTRFDQATGDRSYFAGFAVPTGLAATADDLYAADLFGAGGGTVYQLVRNGVTLPAIEVVATGLQGPEGLAVTKGGDLVVVEAWPACADRPPRVAGQGHDARDGSRRRAARAGHDVADLELRRRRGGPIGHDLRLASNGIMRYVLH